MSIKSSIGLAKNSNERRKNENECGHWHNCAFYHEMQTKLNLHHFIP